MRNVQATCGLASHRRSIHPSPVHLSRVIGSVTMAFMFSAIKPEISQARYYSRGILLPPLCRPGVRSFFVIRTLFGVGSNMSLLSPYHWDLWGFAELALAADLALSTLFCLAVGLTIIRAGGIRIIF